jgi:hypothetical protein
VMLKFARRFPHLRSPLSCRTPLGHHNRANDRFRILPVGPQAGNLIGGLMKGETRGNNGEKIGAPEEKCHWW